MQDTTADKQKNPDTPPQTGEKHKFKISYEKRRGLSKKRYDPYSHIEVQANQGLKKKYRLEEIIERFCQMYGKEIKILWLPVGHSEVNPIELIWAEVKSDVARKNTTFKIAYVK